MLIAMCPKCEDEQHDDCLKYMLFNDGIIANWVCACQCDRAQAARQAYRDNVLKGFRGHIFSAGDTVTWAQWLAEREVLVGMAGEGPFEILSTYEYEPCDSIVCGKYADGHELSCSQSLRQKAGHAQSVEVRLSDDFDVHSLHADLQAKFWRRLPGSPWSVSGALLEPARQPATVA